MKIVSKNEYKFKKNIADNLQKNIDNYFVEISDEEYNRINNAMDRFSEAIQEEFSRLHEINLSDEQKSELQQKILLLENAINELRTVAYDSVDINNHTMDVTNIN